MHNTFAPLPNWEASRYPRDILGMKQLGELTRAIFGDVDPTEAFYRGPIQEVIHVGDTYILRLPLPYVEMDKVLMTKKDNEMIAEIGNFKRDITLLAVLANQEAKLARFVDKALEIHFTAPVEEPEKAEKKSA